MKDIAILGLMFIFGYWTGVYVMSRQVKQLRQLCDQAIEGWGDMITKLKVIKDKHEKEDVHSDSNVGGGRDKDDSGRGASVRVRHGNGGNKNQ